MVSKANSCDFSSFELLSQMAYHYPLVNLSPGSGDPNVVVSNEHLLQGW